MTTNIDLTNRALAESGSRSQISSMTDGSPEALYASLLYAPARDFLLREGDYDFAARFAVTAQLATGAPAAPWAFVYAYPNDCVRIRQMLTADASSFIVQDPTPVEWSVYYHSGANAIGTSVQCSSIFYTTNLAVETAWDAMFTESFVRFFGSLLIFALQNRIEASKERLTEAINFAGIANLRDS